MQMIQRPKKSLQHPKARARFSIPIGILLLVTAREIPAHAESLNAIFTTSRGDLLIQGEPKLKETLEFLKHRNADPHSPGNILENGQKLLKKYLVLDPTHAHEIITLYQALETPSPIHQEFNKPAPTHVTFGIAWMNYSDSVQLEKLNSNGYEATFVNFANAKLGGFWATGGNLQEEQIIQQCPDFPLLLSLPGEGNHERVFYTRKNATSSSQDGVHYFASIQGAGEDSSDPILLTNLRCLQNILRPQAKGAKSSNEKQSDLSNFLEPHLEDAPRVNFISMAAPEIDLKSGDRKYTPLILNDLFNNAFTGFKMAKIYNSKNNKKTHIITGRWGAGAFGHHVSMSVAVQYLAARLAGVEQLEFTGINPEQGGPIIEIVDNLISSAYGEGPETTKLSAQTLTLKLLQSEQTQEWKFNADSHTESEELPKNFKLKLPPGKLRRDQ